MQWRTSFIISSLSLLIVVPAFGIDHGSDEGCISALTDSANASVDPWTYFPGVSLKRAEASNPVDITALPWNNVPRELEGLLKSSHSFVREEVAGRLAHLPADTRSAVLFKSALNDDLDQVREKALSSYLNWLQKNESRDIDLLLAPLDLAIAVAKSKLGYGSLELELRARVGGLLHLTTDAQLAAVFDVEPFSANAAKPVPRLYDIANVPREIIYARQSNINFNVSTAELLEQLIPRLAGQYGATFQPSTLSNQEIFLALKHPDVLVRKKVAKSLPIELNDPLALELWQMALSDKRLEVVKAALDLASNPHGPRLSGAGVTEFAKQLLDFIAGNQPGQLYLHAVYSLRRIFLDHNQMDALNLDLYLKLWQQPFVHEVQPQALIALRDRHNQEEARNIARRLLSEFGPEWAGQPASLEPKTRSWVEGI